MVFGGEVRGCWKGGILEIGGHSDVLGFIFITNMNWINKLEYF